MKRQFVQIQPVQGNTPPAKASHSADWSIADAWTLPSHEASSPLPAEDEAGRRQSDSLGEAENAAASIPAPTKRYDYIAEQDTNVQEVPRPVSDALWQYNNGPHIPMQSSPADWQRQGSLSPISPYMGLPMVASPPTSAPGIGPHNWSYAQAPATPQSPVPLSPVLQPPQQFSPGDPRGGQGQSWAAAWQPAPGAPGAPRAFGQRNNATYNYGNAAPPMRPPTSTPKRRQRNFPIWARVVLAAVLLIVVGGGAGAWYYENNLGTHFSNITGQKAAVISTNNHGKTGNDQQNQVNTTSNTGNIGDKRINILLLGSDNDAKFQGGAPLAQTDIVVTIDPKTKYVGMLSIPRDMRVNIPNGIAAPNKLDTAFAYGWQYVHTGPTAFSNAVGLSILTIQQNYGIPIDHYAWVGLDGFVKVIDTAGGIDIDATHPMVDDDYPNDVNNKNAYDYQRLYIAPGPQHMNGTQALEYVRTRHSDLVGDFGRSARQQQVLSQLKTKLDTPGIIDKLNELAADLDGYVKTDMQLPDLINLMTYARSLDVNKVDRVVLSPPYSSIAADNSGDYLPNCSLIQPKIAQMFGLGANATCESVAAKRQVAAIAGPSTSATRATPNIATTAAAAPVATTTLESLSQAVQNNAMSVGGSMNDPFGVRSLLDVMCMIVFDSFDGAKV